MKTVVAVLAGYAGSGTAMLGSRVASILDWPFASFGAYVRAETARRRLLGTRRELQDIGMELVRDVDGFCRAVIAQSLWRPGQPLVMDGLRHPVVLEALRRIFHPTEVVEIYVSADDHTREERLLERGEFHIGGVSSVDDHPAEKEILALRQSAQATLDGALPEANLINQLLEFLLQVAEVPPNHAWITSENLLYVPADFRQQLNLREGDRMEWCVFEGLLIATKIVDADRMRSVFGRLRRELEEIDPVQWIASMRGRTTQRDQNHESSD